MASNTDDLGHPHTHIDLCEEGRKLYADALRAGRMARSSLTAAPCLIDLALLHPDPDDAQWLRPVPPSAALAQLVLPIEREIQERRRLAADLADSFEPFMVISAQDPATTHAITVLEGLGRINATLDQMIAECTEELLTIQPGGGRPNRAYGEALGRVRPLLGRGVRMQTIYHHTARHTPATLAYLDQVQEVEVRTLEETIDRMIVVDRKVALVPARGDRQVALELRHPGLVTYLVGVFEQFWRLAVPLTEEIHYEPRPDGITGVQLSIARLLVEGYVDDAIARRLGMNVRTCRSHIARLAASLGSGSRAQLGYLVARSGILDAE